MARVSASGVAAMEQAHDSEQVIDFASIVATYEAPISRYLYGMVGDAELARDLTQETFLSAYRALPTVEITNLSGWLYKIATNHALSHFRRKRLITWVSLPRLTAAGYQPSTRGHGDQIATQQSVEEALGRMAPKDRACLLLRAAGFSSAEIADYLGCSEGAARTRLARARETFRRLYHGGDDTLGGD